jgi:hypothetical protein
MMMTSLQAQCAAPAKDKQAAPILLKEHLTTAETTAAGMTQTTVHAAHMMMITSSRTWCAALVEEALGQEIPEAMTQQAPVDAKILQEAQLIQAEMAVSGMQTTLVIVGLMMTATSPLSKCVAHAKEQWVHRVAEQEPKVALIPLVAQLTQAEMTVDGMPITSVHVVHTMTLTFMLNQCVASVVQLATILLEAQLTLVETTAVGMSIPPVNVVHTMMMTS